MRSKEARQTGNNSTITSYNINPVTSAHSAQACFQSFLHNGFLGASLTLHFVGKSPFAHILWDWYCSVFASVSPFPVKKKDKQKTQHKEKQTRSYSRGVFYGLNLQQCGKHSATGNRMSDNPGVDQFPETIGST